MGSSAFARTITCCCIFIKSNYNYNTYRSNPGCYLNQADLFLDIKFILAIDYVTQLHYLRSMRHMHAYLSASKFRLNVTLFSQTFFSKQQVVKGSPYLHRTCFCERCYITNPKSRPPRMCMNTDKLPRLPCFLGCFCHLSSPGRENPGTVQLIFNLVPWIPAFTPGQSQKPANRWLPIKKFHEIKRSLNVGQGQKAEK